MQRADVIVVGAGPVGLVVALGLARAGHEVLVLEKKSATAEHSRAPAIWPRTQEVLAGLGVLESFVERGIVLRRATLRDTDNERDLVSLPFDELEDETAWPQLLILPQSVTETLLATALGRYENAELRFSADVTGIESNGR